MAGFKDVTASLTNSGEMPINASGGAAGDATAKGKNSFQVGGLTMGASGISSQTILIAGLVAVAFFYFNKK
ncbi:hypothetical protein [Vibrio tritonius]|uniref:hypothetical protein n=1 Tax=Vibrio tritonius TaxID=1435069 RepID=UPI00315D3A9E